MKQIKNMSIVEMQEPGYVTIKNQSITMKAKQIAAKERAASFFSKQQLIAACDNYCDLVATQKNNEAYRSLLEYYVDQLLSRFGYKFFDN